MNPRSFDWPKYFQLQALRSLLAISITIFIAQTVSLGVNLPLVLCGVLLGVFLPGKFLGREVSLLRVIGMHLLLYVGFRLVTALISTAAPNIFENPAADFLGQRFHDKASLILLFYGVSFASSWFFWTRAYALSVEALVVCLAFLAMLSGHRNYHIDAPRQISSLTWKLDLLQRYHVEPHHLLLFLSGLFVLVLVSYLIVASSRPLFGALNQVVSSGKRRLTLTLLTIAVFISALFALGSFINQRYSQQISQAMNGVGSSDSMKDGESNLGFNQASSPSRQPAALVRLQNDYTDNPWAPMLYLREGALSEFNGKELVQASKFDTDVPKLNPGEPYVALDQGLEEFRTKVTQSIFILKSDLLPFGIDSPRRFAALKNPNPKRFVYAYQVVSQAPTMSTDSLTGMGVGDPSWSKETLDHYLRAPGSLSQQSTEELLKLAPAQEPQPDTQKEDLRYKAMALTQFASIPDTIERANKIIEYLSEKSIYVRKPGHQLQANGDPIAPYLFAEEKRGYCVHFAHAAAYLFRLNGIPSRIGTGFLTDLTYAKGGDVLLQMGDRHAWPEIYIEGIGWSVFDISPARAENEQTLVPDEKLLEQLMSELDVSEELADPIPLPEDDKSKASPIEQIVDSTELRVGFVLAILLWLGFKFWLRYSYRFTTDPVRKVKRAYTAYASLMTDLGLGRDEGETRTEHAQRLKTNTAVDAERLTSLRLQLAYADPNASQLEEIKAIETYQASRQKSVHIIRRILAFFSLRSLFRVKGW